MELILKNPDTSADEESSPLFQKLWCRYLPVCILTLWFYIFLSGLHWAHGAIIMAPKEPKISKQGAVGSRHNIHNSRDTWNN